MNEKHKDIVAVIAGWMTLISCIFYFLFLRDYIDPEHKINFYLSFMIHNLISLFLFYPIVYFLLGFFYKNEKTGEKIYIDKNSRIRKK